MRQIELSRHAEDMLREREIPEEWLWRAIDSPDHIEIGADGNTHYIKSLTEQGGRFFTCDC